MDKIPKSSVSDRADRAGKKARASKPLWLVRELRSDIAGEAGAVEIYRGILIVARDPEVRAFARAHLDTERKHLDVVASLLDRRDRSALTPLWRLAGFLTGLFPGLLGPTAVYRTIDAVETFVDSHYLSQIERLRAENIHPGIRKHLGACRADEIEHRDEARERVAAKPGVFARAWCRSVAAGSRAAVAVARRL